MKTFDVFVSNLPCRITEDAVYKSFSAAGNVVDGFVMTPEDSWNFTYGFVRFATLEEAQKAVELGKQICIEGRKIMVEFSSRTMEVAKKANGNGFPLIATRNRNSRCNSGKNEVTMVSQGHRTKYEATERQEKALTKQLLGNLTQLKYDSWLREKFKLQETGSIKVFYNYATGVLSSLLNVPEGVCLCTEQAATESISFEELMEDMKSLASQNNENEQGDDMLEEKLPNSELSEARHPFLCDRTWREKSKAHYPDEKISSVISSNKSYTLKDTSLSASRRVRISGKNFPYVAKSSDAGAVCLRSTHPAFIEAKSSTPLSGGDGNDSCDHRNTEFTASARSMGAEKSVARSSCDLWENSKCDNTQERMRQGATMWDHNGPEAMMKELKKANAYKRQANGNGAKECESGAVSSHNEVYESALKDFEIRKSERLARLKTAMLDERMSEDDIAKGLQSLKEENILDQLSVEIQESLRLSSLSP